MHIIQLIQDNWQEILAALTAIYEVIIRLVPTSKSWSLFTILGRIIPDRDTENGTRGVSSKYTNSRETTRRNTH